MVIGCVVTGKRWFIYILLLSKHFSVNMLFECVCMLEAMLIRIDRTIDEYTTNIYDDCFSFIRYYCSSVGQSRGFGFIEFIDTESAKAWMEYAKVVVNKTQNLTLITQFGISC